jgi:release factor glutamine methyltransferase
MPLPEPDCPATLSELLLAARARLAGAPASSADNPRLDSEVLLSHALGRDRAYLLARGDEPAPGDLRRRFTALIERRASGEPVAYLTGRREFWSLELETGPDVLVPRPETELVVERALALCPARTAEVADLGTGSGAIALACAHERRRWRLVATDLSAAALARAAANARRLHLENVHFVRGRWCEPLGARRFDLILSNPPYVAAGDPALDSLRFEPRTALEAGPEGLDHLREIIATAAPHLKSGGALVLEHGADQAPRVAEMLVAAGFAHVVCHADLAGRPRVTEARRFIEETS